VTEYKCGHTSKPIFIKKDSSFMLDYHRWRTTKGFDGDCSQCHSCWFKNQEIEQKKYLKNSTQHTLVLP